MQSPDFHKFLKLISLAFPAIQMNFYQGTATRVFDAKYRKNPKEKQINWGSYLDRYGRASAHRMAGLAVLSAPKGRSARASAHQRLGLAVGKILSRPLFNQKKPGKIGFSIKTGSGNVTPFDTTVHPLPCPLFQMKQSSSDMM